MIDVYTDGATKGKNGKLGTVSEVGIGVWIPKLDIEYSEKCNGISCNEAEFIALIKAMDICIDKGLKSVEFNMDSQVVKNRAIGKNKKSKKSRNKRMDEFQGMVLQRKLYFDNVIFNWIPREENKMADMLSKKSLY